MADLQAGSADHQKAVAEFIAAAAAVSSADWASARASGKWSPGQVVEHLALTYELSRGMLQGRYPGRTAPRLVRPLLRTLFLKPTLRRGHFGKPAKTLPPFEPTAAPDGFDDLTARLRAEATAFENDLDIAAGSGTATFEHPFFGKISLADYLRFQVIHTNHHRRQLTAVG